MSVYGYREGRTITAAHQATLERVRRLFFDSQAAASVSPKDRVAIAEALGRGGDPRLDPLDFLAVPGTGIRLARYPVTVREYQRFVEDEGYQQQRWWGEDWRYREEHDWHAPLNWDEQLDISNRPVVGVSWYEAKAYCRWLSHELGREIRLPTFKEWDAAATPDGRAYPWGNEAPDAERANFGEAFNGATPVGCFPAGQGAYGHFDLAGNVWEWSATSSPKGEDVVLGRGGAWFNPASGLSASLGVVGPAGYRPGDVGFRLAAANTPPGRPWRRTAQAQG